VRRAAGESSSSRRVVAAPVMTASGVRRSCETADSRALRISSVRARTVASRAWSANLTRPRARPAWRAMASIRGTAAPPRPPRVLLGLDCDHADGIVAREQGHGKDVGAGEGVGAAAGGLLVLECPAHDGELLRRERHEAGDGGERAGLVGGRSRGRGRRRRPGTRLRGARR